MSYIPSPQELLFHYIAKGDDTMQIAQRFRLPVGTVQHTLRIAKKDTSAMAKFRKWKSLEGVSLSKHKITKYEPDSRLSFPEELAAAMITPERIKLCNENFK